jgi:hypothetical protein
MRPLDAVIFDARNLVLEGEEGNLRQWHTADGDFITVNYYPGMPDLGGPLSDLAKVVYLGALTLPFCDFSYVVKAQCAESGTTGMRDAAVFAIMMQKGEISFDQNGTPDNWMRDPYDPAVSLPYMRNPSEDPAYDADFPSHPLSRARVLLQHLERTLQVAPEVKSQAKFEG